MVAVSVSPHQFRSEVAAQALQELVQRMTDKCFAKCTGKSGNRLDSKVRMDGGLGGWGDGAGGGGVQQVMLVGCCARYCCFL